MQREEERTELKQENSGKHVTLEVREEARNGTGRSS
jgi:hypothetical protein